jgi:hypothetical protein
MKRQSIPAPYQNRPLLAPEPPKWPSETLLNVRFRTDGPSAPTLHLVTRMLTLVANSLPTVSAETWEGRVESTGRLPPPPSVRLIRDWPTQRK